MGYWKGAQRGLEKAIKFYNKAKDDAALAQALGTLATILVKMGNWDKAIELYNKDLEISKKLGDVHGMAQTYGNLGLAYAKKGDVQKALRYLKEADAIRKSLGLPPLLPADERKGLSRPKRGSRGKKK